MCHRISLNNSRTSASRSFVTFGRCSKRKCYWVDRLRRYPAFGMDDLQPSSNEIRLSYFTGSGLVNAVLTFNAVGQIRKFSWAPQAAEKGEFLTFHRFRRA